RFGEAGRRFAAPSGLPPHLTGAAARRRPGRDPALRGPPPEPGRADLQHLRRASGLAAERRARSRAGGREPARRPSSGVRHAGQAARRAAQPLRQGDMPLLGSPSAAGRPRPTARHRGRAWLAAGRRRAAVAALLLGLLPLPALAATAAGPGLTREYDLKAAFLFNFAHF